MQRLLRNYDCWDCVSECWFGFIQEKTALTPKYSKYPYGVNDSYYFAYSSAFGDFKINVNPMYVFYLL